MKHAQNKSGNKKRVAAIVAVLCLALVGGLATYAWLTRTASLTNNFSTQGIEKPEHNPDPDNPDQPGDEKDGKPDDNLTETKWVPNSVLEAKRVINKNPNVGTGKGSKDAYVYVYVKNDTLSDPSSKNAASKTPYFTLNSGWKAVGAKDADACKAKTNGNDGQYLSGLFVYTGKDTDAAKLMHSTLGESDTDAWTGEVFSTVTVPDGVTKADFAESPTMTVNSYVVAAEGDEANEKTSHESEAIAWANGLAGTTAAPSTQG